MALRFCITQDAIAVEQQRVKVEVSCPTGA